MVATPGLRGYPVIDVPRSSACERQINVAMGSILRKNSRNVLAKNSLFEHD